MTDELDPEKPLGHPGLVSAVIIGRNEGERLRRCLRSVFAMDRTGFDLEVIYVDSGSTDGSVALAEAEGARAITLQPERPSAALGRNAGWRAAHGSIILFLDGDTILHPQFVASSLAQFSDPTLAALWGHRRELNTQGSIFNRTLDLDWIYLPGITPYCGGDALFRRSVLAATNGFDPTLIAGEEPELCRRVVALGYYILHVDHPMTAHDLAITRWSQYWKRNTRAGHAFAEVADRFRNTDQPFWSEAVTANRNRFLAIVGALLAAILASALLRSLVPLALYLALFALLSLRSAWKARWKTNDRVALLMYGINSHLQQVPIYIGQLQYQWSRRRGQRIGLIEYK
jgi:cellulose synthase/poly-beta-1,6-N-acetylglucosamine synthase-like glycosyltransferase